MIFNLFFDAGGHIRRWCMVVAALILYLAFWLALLGLTVVLTGH